MIENNLHILFPNLLNMDYETLDWKPFHGGITIFPLYKSSDTEASAALLKYIPGAAAPEHIHQGYEHILVLEGSQEDATAVYEKGAFVINKPHTQHWVRSKNGCVVLAIWEKPVKFI
jgi:anti-sigma factor ChrR (cupin superfamily)